MPGSDSRDVLARLTGTVPDAQVALIEAWRAGGSTVDPVRAASVVLLRETAGGLETYLLHRHSRMPFAAGMVVFPGGRVDPADEHRTDDDRTDDDRTDEDAWVRCAIRETREETSVVLGSGDLVDWAHWVTPAFEPRRYDTRFYLAELPPRESARDQSGETDRAGWSRPAAALAEADAGRIALMPPTRSILLELADLPDLPTALDAADGRLIEPVQPVPVRTDAGWVFRYLPESAEPGGER